MPVVAEGTAPIGLVQHRDRGRFTFLMVALLQNSQMRADQAVQHKLNAIADALADLMLHIADEADSDDLRQDRIELHDAIGLELRESTSHNVA